MKLASLFLVGHLAALLFGLAGLLVALPNPQWWSGDANAVRVFEFGMEYAGATHIVLGAAAVFVFGWVVLGPRRTVIFFLVSTLLSLSSELIGTGTGWPFGNYEYTAFLGYKVLDRVPFSIPLWCLALDGLGPCARSGDGRPQPAGAVLDVARKRPLLRDADPESGGVVGDRAALHGDQPAPLGK
jgi:uncharacterized membrane protein